ncbi:MAG TPA: toll/interleukin-1 receptor domain-containing protein [Caulobacteraceae bacterium]|nr:toll/interleukin-1 receptor domain-containing protein [Caulobacteraceae bacterium]
MGWFLSYARADSVVALRIAGGLKTAGVELWVDQHDIRPSEHWDRAVEAALRAAEGVIVILSPRSAASANVADEVSLALDAGKRVIPILVEPAQAPLRMTRLQFIDATKDEADALRRCLATLGAPATAPASPASAAVSSEALARVTKALTPHLGPIAARLVEREARTAASLAVLLETLALQIPAERDRAAFRRAAG